MSVLLEHLIQPTEEGARTDVVGLPPRTVVRCSCGEIVRADGYDGDLALTRWAEHAAAAMADRLAHVAAHADGGCSNCALGVARRLEVVFPGAGIEAATQRWLEAITEERDCEFDRR